MKKIISIQDIRQRLHRVHGDTVVIKDSSYVGASKKAVFVDMRFGEWIAYVSNVLAGHSHPLRGREKIELTNLQKYGNVSHLSTKDIRQKIENTCLERYGVKNPLGSEEIRIRVKKTLVQRYGVDNPQKSPLIRNKTLETHFKRHGVFYPLQSVHIMNKVLCTNLRKFGVKNVFQSPTVRAKIAKTCIERFGVENPAQSIVLQRKSNKKSRNVTMIRHWKTGENLRCTGSYEVAFVNWCNKNQINFDWQIRFEMPMLTPKGKKSFYFIDAYVKDGILAGTWVEIKGTFSRKNGHVGKIKWEWFHAEHTNSCLLILTDLHRLNIVKRKSIQNQGCNDNG